MMRRLLLGIVAVALTTVPALAALGASSAAAKDQPSGVTIVNLNLLHGVFCGNTNFCQGPDRVKLLGRQLEAAHCPDIVGLQEINQAHEKLLEKLVKSICDGKYKIVFKKHFSGPDAERVLTTLEIKRQKVLTLAEGFRAASRVELSSPEGPIVLVVTHQDGDPDTPFTGTCRTCKPPCTSTDTPMGCQTTEALAFGAKVGGPDAIHILMGDFNVTPASARYQQIISEGYVDSYLAAGNPECVPATGVGCTSGRDDMHVEALKDPNAKESERIDFIFVKPPAGCELGFDPVDDRDGDGLGTGLFGSTPAVNGPGGIVWTSDHTAVSADLSCDQSG